MGTTVPNVRKESDPALSAWLRQRREAIRSEGASQLAFEPVAIEGEPLSATIVRERRSDAE